MISSDEKPSVGLKLTEGFVSLQKLLPMKAHLLEMFAFNQRANERMIDLLGELQNPQAVVRLLGHLIHSQNKWLARIRSYPESVDMDWWEPTLPAAELKDSLARSTQAWLEFLQNKTEEELTSEIRFHASNGSEWVCVLQDIALQLIFHSFHHRAQMQTLLRAEGSTPPFIDYIGEKYRRV